MKSLKPQETNFANEPRGHVPEAPKKSGNGTCFRTKKKAQSALEYSLIIATVIAAILIMQVFIKRAYQSRLKDSGDSISSGQNYSAGSTTVLTTRRMNTPQVVHEAVAGKHDRFMTDEGSVFVDLARDWAQDEPLSPLNDGSYSVSVTSGGVITSAVRSKTDGAAGEDFRRSEYLSGSRAYSDQVKESDIFVNLEDIP